MLQEQIISLLLRHSIQYRILHQRSDLRLQSRLMKRPGPRRIQVHHQLHKPIELPHDNLLIHNFQTLIMLLEIDPLRR